MMRSLFSGVTGLKSHQTRMDVIGNNIANVNTVGFKKSTFTFKDLYSETLSAASGANAQMGGLNPKQIGLGTSVGSITTVQSPGSAEYTGNITDVAISGDGYFIVRTPEGLRYTRAGNFRVDTQGNLVTSDGYFAQVVDAIPSTATRYMLNSVVTNSLFPVNSVVEQPSGVIHQGNIPTEILETYGGETLHFEYKPDGTGLSSDIAVKYLPKLPDGSTLQGLSSDTIDMAAVAARLLSGPLDAGTDPLSPTGVYTVGFIAGTGTNEVDMVLWDCTTDPDNPTKLATIGTFDAGDVEIDADGVAVIDLGNFGSLSFKSADETNPLVEGTNNEDALMGLLNLVGLDDPETNNIPLDEAGGWYLMSGTTQIERVNLSTRTNANGEIAVGDIVFSTANFGTITMRLNTNMNGNAALSEALTNSTFSLDVLEEPYVLYDGPQGELAEGALHTLQIDFQRYGNMSIDDKGAVKVQLLRDEYVTVGGQQVLLKAGESITLGYVALANFANPQGLTKVGENLYEQSSNSGEPVMGLPGTGNAGKLSTSSLEMSNVDLSEEMVSMIITQRGFQANSRIITTSDTMLEELINLKR